MYNLTENYFEIYSDLYKNILRVSGVPSIMSQILLDHLTNGVHENNASEYLQQQTNFDLVRIEKILEALWNKKFLIRSEKLSQTEVHDTLYDRQVRFLDTFETCTTNGDDFNKKLQNRKVVIIGLGAYGSWLALHCARLGIKHIVGIDYDKVEISNLHRQIIYTQFDIGQPKVSACRKALLSTDSLIKYEGINKKIANENDLIPHLDQCDLVFNAFGYIPKLEAENKVQGFITKACITTRTPMLCLSANWVGPLYIPRISACYFCAVTHPSLENIIGRYKKNPSVEKRAFTPLLALSCSLAVSEMARFLSGISIPQVVDGILTIDPFAIKESNLIPVAKSNECKYCNIS